MRLDDSDTHDESGTAPALRVNAEPQPTLTVLSHPDRSRVGESAELPSWTEGKAQQISRYKPLFYRPGSAVGCHLSDQRLSRGGWSLQPDASGVRLQRRGSVIRLFVSGRPALDDEFLPRDEIVDKGIDLVLGRRVALLLHGRRTTAALMSDVGNSPLLGNSEAMCLVRAEVSRICDTKLSALVRGETGTGKELVAFALHHLGKRRSAPFRAVSLAALPAHLAVAELFGSSRGAYTGAESDRDGYFQQAGEGTLFLDEIGDASEEVQLALLRALEAGEIQRVGAKAPEPFAARVVSATDSRLEERIEEGTFRSALYHRLNGYTIELPPLRRHLDDLGLLLEHFCELEARELTPATSPVPNFRVPAAWLAALVDHPWPGNVRELRNLARQLVVERATQGPRKPPPLIDELLRRRAGGNARTNRHQRLRQADSSDVEPGAAVPAERPRRLHPDAILKETILAALKEHGWSVQKAAKELEVRKTTLYDWIKRHPEVRRGSDLTENEIRSALRESRGRVDQAASALGVSSRALKIKMTALGVRPED